MILKFSHIMVSQGINQEQSTKPIWYTEHHIIHWFLSWSY